MWFPRDGTGWALCCVAHGELAWHFQNHIQGWMNDLNMLLSCFIEKMPALSLPFFLPVAFPSLLSLRPSLPSPRTQLISPRGTSLVCHRRHRILQSELWAGRGRRGHTSQVFILQRRDDRPCFDTAGFYPGFYFGRRHEVNGWHLTI